jgi:hypothetical protein
MADKAPRKFRYVGPHDAVDVPALGVRVKRNHQVEVADKAVADSFAMQGDWEEVGAPKPKAPEQEEEKVVTGD